MKIKKTFCILATVLLLITSTLLPVFAASEISTADLQNMRSGVVSIYGISNNTGWTGTGFCVSEESDGSLIIVTNSHVVLDEPGTLADVLFIPLENDFITEDGIDVNKIVELEVIYYNNAMNPDIAVLRTTEPITNVYKFSLALTDHDLSGEKVYAMGYPGVVQGDDTLIEAKDVVITDGIISTELDTTSFPGSEVLLHSATSNHGNSGGPIISSKGAVVGINAAVYSEDNRYAIAMSVSELIDILDDLDIDYTIFGTEEKGTANSTIIILIVAIIVVLIAVAVVVILVVKSKKRKPVVEEISFTNVVETPTAPVQNNIVKSVALKGIGGYMDGRTYELTEDITQIGRNSECIIRYPDGIEGISKVHCKITKQGSSLFIEDKSTYGTFLQNGERLTEGRSYELNDKDIIFLASEKNAFMVTKN